MARFGKERSEWPGSLWNNVVAIAVDVQSNRMWAASLADPNRTPAPQLTEEERKRMNEPDPDDEPGDEPEEERPLAEVPPPEPGDPPDPDPPLEPGQPGPDPVVVGTGPIGEYANVDLRRSLGLPPTPASYWIHFTLGAHQSNAIRVEIVTDRGGE
jgi:hypothetical protein